MHQVPTSVWNEIAATQHLTHPVWRRLLPLEGMRFLEALDELEKRVDEVARDARVTRAYCLTAPLLQETRAISRFVEASGAPSLRGALPELTTIHEAVDLATREYSLTRLQRRSLASMLRGLSL